MSGDAREGGYCEDSPLSDFEPQLGTGVQQSNNITTNSDKTTLLIILKIYHISTRVKENNDVIMCFRLNRKIIL